MASQDQPRPKTMTYSKRNNRVEKGEQKKQFTPRKRASESEDDGICDLCVLPIKIFAIGYCNHPICFRCSAKMRSLCEQMHCAVCRVEMKKVIYSKSRRTFAEANDLRLLKDKSNNWFTDEIVKKEYRKLFEHRCNICPDVEAFYTLDKLKTHLRKEHQLQFCDICVKFNKNFTDEYKTYSREALGRHRRLGDEDDKSHRGHPLCEFCDDRYVDNDALLLHLRTDHYFCHICDQGGTNEYYAGYIELRGHYKHVHYLCEEGDCKNEQFTSVFASDLDFKAHQTAVHAENMTRQQLKAERKIDLGFQYSNPPGRGGRGAGRSDDFSGRGRGRGRGLGRGKTSREEEDFEMAKALSLSEQETAKDPKRNSKPASGRPRVKTREEEQRKTPPPPDEPTPLDLSKDFPTLGLSKEEEPQSLYTYSSIGKQTQEEKTQPETRNVVPTAATKVASAYGKSTGRMTEEDFPSLGSGNKGAGQVMGSIWGSSTLVAGPKAGAKSKPSQPVSVHMPAAMFGNRRDVNIKSKEEFPSLGGRSGSAIPNKTTWGQTPVSASAPRKSAPKNTSKSQTAKKTNPIVNHVAAYKPPPQNPKTTSNSDMISCDETVSIRVGSGKHSMRLTSAKHNEDISDIERPIDVPGVGNTSVKTVTADTFSLLSGYNSGGSRAERSAFQVQSGNEFPELGGGGRPGGRIKGVGGPKFPGDPSWGVASKAKNNKKTPLSLSDISNDIFPSSTIDNIPSGGKKTKTGKQNVNNANKKMNVDTVLKEEDFPAFAKAPAISSYPANWVDDDGTSVADTIVKENNFTVQDGDFPTLGGNTGRQNAGGKKNKKRKKNKKVNDANDLTKHFGKVTIEESQNGGHLESLLKGQQKESNSLSTILDQNGMFEPNPAETEKEVEVEEWEESDVNGQHENEIEPLDVTLQPRPDDDDVNGRNLWLIRTVQQLCGTDENFSEFKSCSAEFRRGNMIGQSYYDKCLRLLGKRHFPVVFGELVDLLPDEDKRAKLLRVHHNMMSK